MSLAPEELSVLFDRSPIGMFRATEAGEFRAVNPALARMLGYDSVDELKTKNLTHDVYVDPATRRILVRASVDNAENLLKPEMFATVTIFSPDGEPSPAVPRQAVIYQGDTTRVWVAREDKTLESRPIRLGLINDATAQVIAGLDVGERVVTKGYLFIDRAAAGN